MNSIIITPKNEQEYSEIVSFLKKMKVKMKVAPLAEDKLHQMTIDEFNEMIDQSLEDARQGRVISQEELKKEMEQW